MPKPTTTDNGILSVNGQQHKVQYTIRIWSEGGKRHAEGTLTGESKSALERAAVTDGCELRLKGGEVVEVAVSEVVGSDNLPSARFKVEPIEE